MKNNRLTFPGSRWWKFDFHTHTPASWDYGKGEDQVRLKQRTPREWLLDYMREEIDCVAVTDHNSGDWIDKLKTEYERMKKEEPDGFRKLFIFPGVELTVNGGIHILAIFDPLKTTADIIALIGAVKYSGTRGKSDACTEEPVVKVIEEIINAGGLAIPAHVDESCGIFDRISGPTLKQVLDSRHVFAMELIEPGYSKPQLYIDKKITWTEVLGSDAHHPPGENGSNAGKRFTWVKMGKPAIAGLRLALLDGSPLSIRRGDLSDGDPNECANQMIRGISIKDAQYCGRGEPLKAEFNPWLNAIIGGRGTGKSTLIEFLRIVLRRDNELPDKLQKAFDEFKQVPGSRDAPGVLTEKTKVQMAYQKEGRDFLIQWSTDGSVDAIKMVTKEGRKTVEGDIPVRFPVRIFSQKQIFEMAVNPKSLFHVIDDAPTVNAGGWNENMNRELNRFLSLRARIRTIEDDIKKEGAVKGSLDDVMLKLDAFESSGKAEVFKNYQEKIRQGKALKEYKENIDAVIEMLNQAAESVVIGDFRESLFHEENEIEKGVLDTVRQTQEQLRAIKSEVGSLTEKTRSIAGTWDELFKEGRSPWMKMCRQVASDYKSLKESSDGGGGIEPRLYQDFVQKREVLEQRLRRFKEQNKAKVELEKEAKQCLERFRESREKLSMRRGGFLDEVLKDNPYVRITLHPFEDKTVLEDEFRQLINREDGRAQNDILSEDKKSGILAELYNEFSEAGLAALKRKVIAAAVGEDVPGMGGWLSKHLRKLTPETLDRLECWYPGDALRIQYSASGDRKNFKSIEQGSPGQKTAALLAFLLSYGDEPMVLDQPEDDLDNHLIYELVVAQLRENKRKRQIIVVTHNPNIVVNGDAEMVFALNFKKGQTRISQKGSLQEPGIRNEVCRVMEGGREAFEKRYRRMFMSTEGETDV